MKTGRRLIGLTGTNASGKGEAAAFFMGRGFTYFSQSDVIRDELRQKNLEPTRDNLIREGNELRQRFGPDILARRVMDKVTGDSIIDSIRNPSEIEYWRIQGNFILLAIDAPMEVRFQRAVSRGRDESAASIEDFKAKEDQEKTRDRMAQQLETCMRMADSLILNDGTLEEYHKKLEAFL
ncbi:MAG: AAA family ATPase [Candidatus Aminicenantaceae bacterium]